MLQAILLIAVFALTLSGCAFLGGAAVGAAGTGAAYESQHADEMEELEEDYESGRISRQEYERRKDDIDDSSVVY